MKKTKMISVVLALTMLLAACGSPATEPNTELSEENSAVEILLDDDGITVDGVPAGQEPAAVYTANDIIFYESGRDFTYGEGTEEDAHSAEEAAAHTVVHITEPGTYSIRGTLSRGQIAVDLGKDAEEDPNAVVTLILDGADITCAVAPAVIFYNVYECGSSDTESASKDVDTAAAGANVVIGDGTVNNVSGAYVARIYKPDSVVLSEDGKSVADAKKLHKYDAAFYSKMSMNVDGGSEDSGVLNIHAQNEGLDSELHLTINGGNINIRSGNDGINTNEDGISVTTINGGTLNIHVTGETGEGDGIDSNGWLVINGGTVAASACAHSADAGIDSDMGIHINGGTVMASGHMLDRIEDGGQTYAVFNFAQEQSGSDTLRLKNKSGAPVMECCPQNDYSVMIFSAPDLTEGTYTLWSGEKQLSGQTGGGMPGFGGHGMMRPGFPEDMTPPEGAEDMRPPEGFDGEMPEGFENMTPPEGMPPEGGFRPDGQRPPEGFGGGEPPAGGWNAGRMPSGRGDAAAAERSAEFMIVKGANMFAGITYAE